MNIYPDYLIAARQLALRAHGGAVNKHDGELYLLHVSRVAFTASSFGSLAETVAWLHDVVEDTSVTLSEVSRLMQSCQELSGDDCVTIVQAVDVITKRHGETNEDYYDMVKLSHLATQVKRCDMYDNFRRNHLITDDTTRARMAKKYSLGVDILGTFP